MNLKGRSLSSLRDYSKAEIDYLLTLSAQLKKEKKEKKEKQRLEGKNIILIFEKPSTRTRCAFEVAAFDQGAHITYLNPADAHMGYKESVKDTARVLGRYYDGIEFRGFSQQTLETLIEFSGVPVWNGLTDDFHPTQVLAVFLTMQEHAKKPLSDISFCYLGDGKNNVATSLMIGAAKMGMDCRIACPTAYFPKPSAVKTCEVYGADSGAKLLLTDNIEQAVLHCDFLYTDVWVSMGEKEAAWKQKLEDLLPYQVNQTVLQMTQNKNCKFMHCLPAFHNTETVKGEEIFKQYHLSALEVTEDVFESPASIVFDQAENRLHTIKAVMVATL